MAQCQLAGCPLLTWCLAHGELHAQDFQVERCPECKLYQVRIYSGPLGSPKNNTTFTPQMTSLPACFQTLREFDYRLSPDWCYCSIKCSKTNPTLTQEAWNNLYGK